MKTISDQLKTQNFYLSILATIGTAFILYLTKSFMIPLVIAILFGVLFSPAISYLQTKNISAVFGSILIFIFIFTILTVLGFLLYGAISSVINNLDKYTDKMHELIRNISNYLERNFDYDLEQELRNTDRKKVLTLFSANSIIKTIENSLGSFMSFFSDLLMMLLFLMFILMSLDAWQSKIRSYLSSHNLTEEQSEKIVNSIVGQIQDYLWLKTLISVGTGLVVWLVALVCGLDFPIVWGFLAFLMNYIPSIGPIIAAIPPIFLAYFQFLDHIWWATFISISMIVIQFISGNIIEPKLMGNKLNLNILVVLICLFVWGMIWGFAGMVLSVPLTASINIILNNSKKYKNISTLLSN